MPTSSKPKWKREEIPDHKFHFVNLSEYVQSSWLSHIAYSAIFFATFASIVVYLADFSTALFVAVYDKWALDPNEVNDNAILDKSFTNIFVKAAKGIYLASIAISFFLLILDFRKSLKIIRSDDISFAFTDTMAYRYYSIRSYGHWCFFNQVSNQHRFSDSLSLFVFFRLQGWKRLFFAETPRQLVNLVLVIAAVDNMRSQFNEKNSLAPASTNLLIFLFSSQFYQNVKFAVLIMIFVLLSYLLSVLSTALSFMVYIPLVFRIKGNFKEYICHMIDKRISELLKKKAWKRIQRYQNAGWDGPQPELPNLSYLKSPLPSPSLSQTHFGLNDTYPRDTGWGAGGGGAYLGTK
ncbi:hypothetical protein HMI54_002678 [Coelomomyces lativittatus]|nr:hypothetical protein HMI56_003982 [Coelomomyces lativittatus]KAJ1509038.1 hypothetical protein HMI54_002678 [Coelomomyces lativittatus]KAJ1516462.1 hypothetical protein HMI55_002203 [Coelomomyces lativittatus]